MHYKFFCFKIPEDIWLFSIYIRLLFEKFNRISGHRSSYLFYGYLGVGWSVYSIEVECYNPTVLC